MAEGISTWQYQTKSGKKWAFEVRGQLTHAKVQRRGFYTQQDAMRSAKQFRLDRLAEKVSAAPKVNLKTLTGEYLASISCSVRPHTLANYKDLLDRYLLPKLGALQIAEIDEPQISSLLRDLHSAGLLPGTVNTVRARIIGLFSYAVRRRLVAFNAAKETRPLAHSPASRSAVREPLSAPEARELLKRAQGTDLDLFISLCLGLGLRKGEALGLRGMDVNLRDGILVISRTRGQQRYIAPDGSVRSIEADGEPKTSASARTVRLNAVVLTALQRANWQEVAGRAEYLVHTDGGHPMSLSVLHRSYKRLFDDGGLRYVRIHDLRHTAAMLALEGQAPLAAVSQSLGHASLEITKRIYAPRVQILDTLFSSTLNSVLAADAEEIDSVVRGEQLGLAG